MTLRDTSPRLAIALCAIVAASCAEAGEAGNAGVIERGALASVNDVATGTLVMQLFAPSDDAAGTGLMTIIEGACAAGPAPLCPLTGETAEAIFAAGADGARTVAATIGGTVLRLALAPRADEPILEGTLSVGDAMHPVTTMFGRFEISAGSFRSQ
ncbi:hypothetical protein RDV64_05765 [Acuticoccus sp. MNP-M23]|uniref:hypothetical protein n=1 Tax=Acuticoccus sp. MNP-M23 TaxID=3072793 RepID=UPI002815B6E2|nr:hypothetical protein [Acuticoccus sp. MNP-M23]WMS43897.1 hypothetical protein RDV64_05765 [Acuticoccus sp. MNP-M23]